MAERKNPLWILSHRYVTVYCVQYLNLDLAYGAA